MKALFLACDGKGPTPFYWFIGRLCEEFGGRLPREVYAEWEALPTGFMEAIVEGRAFVATRQQIDAAPDMKSQPTGEMADLVLTIRKEVHEDEIRAELARREANG